MQELEVEPTPEWAPAMWEAWRHGEIGWKVRLVTEGEDEGEIAWIARRITVAHTQRWPELELGEWVLIGVDAETGALVGTPWWTEPGRLAPRRDPRPSEPLPF